MGLPAARDPANWEESRTSARRGNEIREWESGARARLVGPGVAACAGGAAGPGEIAGRGRRAGQKAPQRRQEKRGPDPSSQWTSIVERRTVS